MVKPTHHTTFGVLLRQLHTVMTHGWRVTHSSLALAGLAVCSVALVMSQQVELCNAIETKALHWLMARQGMDPTPDTDAARSADHITAAEPQLLPKDQAKITFWLSRKYRVAAEPLSVLVAEAHHMGKQIKLDPTLILAVMAIESRFNPFSQSPYGAQGLMQVLTSLHKDKYTRFGGQWAAFDPVSNLRVGIKVLQECIARADGNIEDGLKSYVGAVSVDAGGYVAKVMAEQVRLKDVASGKSVPITNPVTPQLEPATTIATAKPSEAHTPQTNKPPASALAQADATADLAIQ